MNDDSINYMKSKVTELDKLKAIQVRNIETGFDEIIKRLDLRKKIIKNEYSMKYEKEKQKIEDAMRPYSNLSLRLVDVR